jgi:uncharacterized protein YecT (DUF1311 family)
MGLCVRKVFPVLKLLAPTLVFALLPLSAVAQESDCAEAVTQVDMNACAQAAWEAADADLNTAYGAAVDFMTGLDADLPEGERGAVEALRAAQRAWIAYRDAACAAEAFTVRGGSIEPLVRFACLERLTRVQTGTLDAFRAY